MVIEYGQTDTLPANNIALSSVSIDGGTQSRASVDQAVVADYADAMRNGAGFPPIVLFHDGKAYWLADGFHRYHALKATGAERVIADVRQGTRRDAILFSVGANASHGLRRTNEDKRRAVSTLLQDDEWSAWSDREIARRCAVSDKTVAAARKDTAEFPQCENRTFVHPKTGQPATMNTAAIGKPVQHSGYEIEKGLTSSYTPGHGVPGDGPNLDHGAKLRHEGFQQLVEDDITEEDLANDPGFQKAVEALNSAKALYDEVQAMPAAEAMTPEREANLQRAFGTPEDRANFMRIVNAIRIVEALPDANAMVNSIPPTLDHAVDVLAILKTSEWFETFARAWERKGAPA